jgi:hypothetical protein
MICGSILNLIVNYIVCVDQSAGGAILEAVPPRWWNNTWNRDLGSNVNSAGCCVWKLS